MSWTDTQPIPLRQPGEPIRDIQFSHELDGQRRRTERIVGQFYHRDGRLWQARILPLPNRFHDGQHSFNEESLVLTLSSAGCRNYQFVSGNIGSAKRVAIRFGNIPISRYNRVVADAQGTAAHPRTNDIGVFRVNIAKQVLIFPQSHETQRYSLVGIGRVEHGTIVMFPQAAELEAIFENVCDDDTVPLIAENINDPTTDNDAFRLHQQVSSEEMDEWGDVSDIVARNFQDTVEQALEGLQSGTYHTSGFRRREDRVIDIGDD